MSIPHAEAGTIIDINPLGDHLKNLKTHTLVKTSDMEIIRLVILEGNEIMTHKAPGRMTLQCIEGEIVFTTMGKDLILKPGTMLYLDPEELHSLKAINNSSLLLTILLPK